VIRKMLLCAALCVWFSSAAFAVVVRIDSKVSGYTPSDPAPTVGETGRSPINPATLTLPAGTYDIYNAYAQGLETDPYYRAWTFGNSYNWAWTIFGEGAGNPVLLHVQEDFYRPTADQVAALPVVQNFHAILSLSSETTLRFGVRDSGLGDNNGGIALSIVPEPAALAVTSGFLCLAATARQRRRR
jgi:hypothetical protein